MNSENRMTVTIVFFVCILLGWGAVQVRGCEVSDNEVKKVNDTNAVKLGEQAAKAKADCLNAGCSYDDRGACYCGGNARTSK